MTNRPMFLGLGSHHGDDQAGWLVIDRLHQCGVPVANAVAVSSPDEIWHRRIHDRKLILCDATVDPGKVGTIRQWSWPGVQLPELHHGTHDFPLGAVLTLGQTLELCPAKVVIWTIAGRRFSAGDEISPSVRQAAISLANTLYEEFSHA